MKTHTFRTNTTATTLEELLQEVKSWASRLAIVEPEAPQRVTVQLVKSPATKPFQLQGVVQRVTHEEVMLSVDAYQQTAEQMALKVVRMRYFYRQ